MSVGIELADKGQLTDGKTVIERLRSKLQIGIDQLDRGEGIPFDAEVIKSEGRKRLTQKEGK